MHQMAHIMIMLHYYIALARTAKIKFQETLNWCLRNLDFILILQQRKKDKIFQGIHKMNYFQMFSSMTS